MPDDPIVAELSRRDVIKAGTSLAAATAFSGTTAARDIQQEQAPVKPVAWLLGTVDRDPNTIPELAPGGPFFSGDGWEKTHYAYIYQTESEGQWYITEDTDRWQSIRMNPETQIEEVRTREFEPFFDLHFARPESPDTKNWAFDPANVTKDVSEIELASTATLESTQRGNYPPGTEVIAGVAGRVTGVPTAGEAKLGYFNGSDGFGVGEDPTDSFVFLLKGGREYRVHRSDWNAFVPDNRVFVNDHPVVARMPHLFYGGGRIEIKALLHEDGRTNLRTLHRFTPSNTPSDWGDGPPFNQPNQPLTFKSDGLTGGALRANAAHYEIGNQREETRINGEHFSGVDAPTDTWTPLMSWEKRPGDWNYVNVKPQKISVGASGNDAKLEIQLDTTLTNATFSLPVNTSSSETSVEVTRDGDQGTIGTNGERRWTGYASAGQGNASGQTLISDVDFNLPAGQIVTLAAQGVGGTATLSGAIGWEEYF